MSEPVLSGVDDLFKPMARRYKIVTLPISGGVIRIQSLTERESSELQMEVMRVQNGQPTMRADRLQNAARRLIVRCVVDAAGNRMLNQEHIDRMSAWDAADVQFLYEECSSHVGLKSADLEAIAKKLRARPRYLIAMQMAEKAGILDVDRWLDTIEPEKFDKWIAYKTLINPDPEWRLREILKNGFAASCLGGVEPEMFDPHKEPANDPIQSVSPKQAGNLLRMAYGG